MGDNSGVSVAGDVNKDGSADVIISTFHSTTEDAFESGQSYVVFGFGADPTLQDV